MTSKRKPIKESYETKKRTKPSRFDILKFILTCIISLTAIVISFIALNRTKVFNIALQRKAFKKQIVDFMDYERDFYQEISNPSIDQSTKDAIISLYNTKISLLSNKIMKEFKNNTSVNFDALTLNDCADLLKRTHKVPAAIGLTKIALEKCKDKYDSGTTFRNLATFYLMPSDSFNIKKSLQYRVNELKLLKRFPRELSQISVVQSYLNWANDEFIYQGRKELAFSLIDSAAIHLSNVSNENERVDYHLQIQSLKSLIIGIKDLNKSFWQVFHQGKKIGVASLFVDNSSTSLSISILNSSILTKQIKLVGNFISQTFLYLSGSEYFLKDIQAPQPTKIMFGHIVDVKIEKKQIPQQKNAIAILHINNDSTISINYSRLGNKSVNWKLKYIQIP